MLCKLCYGGWSSGRVCREQHQALEEEYEAEYQAERLRAIIILCGLLLQPQTWRSLAADIAEMEWWCWREAAVWWWAWRRLLVIRAVICLVMEWRKVSDEPAYATGYWIEDLWVAGDYWYWVSVGAGWRGWWAYVDRDCSDSRYY